GRNRVRVHGRRRGWARGGQAEGSDGGRAARRGDGGAPAACGGRRGYRCQPFGRAWSRERRGNLSCLSEKPREVAEDRRGEGRYAGGIRGSASGRDLQPLSDRLMLGRNLATTVKGTGMASAEYYRFIEKVRSRPKPENP